MPTRWNRIRHITQISTTRARPWGGLLALVGALLVIALLVAMAGLKILAVAFDPVTSPAAAPPETDFLGAWCSSHGDRLVLSQGHFTVEPMSPALAGQVDYRVSTPEPGRSPRWNDPPATTAAGSWGVSVLGADLMSGQVVTVEVEIEEIGHETVISDALEFGVHERDAGRYLSLPLKPHGSGAVAFSRC